MGADPGGAGMQVDMSDEGRVAAMVAAASRSLPQLSIFVNNAAVFVLKSVTEASEAGGRACQPSCALQPWDFGKAPRPSWPDWSVGDVMHLACHRHDTT